MGRNTGSKCRECRAAGEKLLLKGERCSSAKCALIKRNYAPGAHGQNAKGRRRLSGYGEQLLEKQTAKKFYGLSEKQFRLTFEKAAKKTGDAGKNFLRALEMRLDNVVYRIGFAVSRAQARQLVNHGHFTVNDRLTDIPSFSVKAGQVIKIKKTSVNSRYFRNIAETLKKAERPSWLNLDANLGAKVLHEPKDADLPQDINVQVIIEYYSK
jgi:small subunit ribosomal protein S4